jgi:putative (di)nucleoside polyphosphate hydrolase
MYRKGVSALIINKKKELLLVNLESFEDKYFAIPGGGVEPGETLEEAVYREIHEELSIEKKSLQFVRQSNIPIRFKFKVIKMIRGDKDYEGSERYFFGFRFISANNEIQPKKGEVRYYKWIPFEQLKDYLLFDGQLKDTQEKIIEIFGFKGKKLKIRV